MTVTAPAANAVTVPAWPLATLARSSGSWLLRRRTTRSPIAKRRGPVVSLVGVGEFAGGDEVVDGGVVEPVDEFVGPGEQHRIVTFARASAHKAIAWSIRSVGVAAT